MQIKVDCKRLHNRGAMLDLCRELKASPDQKSAFAGMLFEVSLLPAFDAFERFWRANKRELSQKEQEEFNSILISGVASLAASIIVSSSKCADCGNAQVRMLDATISATVAIVVAALDARVNELLGDLRLVDGPTLQ
jgi:hypothetical protein